jgi:hypothetical protein
MSEQGPSAEKDAGLRVDQTILAGDPKRKGNCVAACVATLLGIPLTEVPHFIEFGIAYGDSEDVHDVSAGNNWWAMLLGFMAAKGWWPVELDSVTSGEVGETLFVAGKSPRGVSHQVLYREGRLWHDPHPSRDGILTVDEVIAWRPLPGFDHEPTSVEEDAA